MNYRFGKIALGFQNCHHTDMARITIRFRGFTRRFASVFRQEGASTAMCFGVVRFMQGLLGYDSTYALAAWLNDKFFDLRYGVDTSGIVQAAKLDLPGEVRVEASSYVGVSPRAFRKAISRLHINASEFTFVDCGSGKGRVLVACRINAVQEGDRHRDLP